MSSTSTANRPDRIVSSTKRERGDDRVNGRRVQPRTGGQSSVNQLQIPYNKNSEDITQARKDEIFRLIFQDLSEDEMTVEKALKTLADLCRSSKIGVSKKASQSHSTWIVKLGGHGIITHLITKHQQSEDILLQGFRALTNIAQWCDTDTIEVFSSAKFVKMAVKTTKHFPKITFCICALFRNCLPSLSGQPRQQLAELLVTRCEAIRHIAEASRLNWTSIELHHHAAELLKHLAEFEELRRIVVKDGGAMILGTALKLFDPESQDFIRANATLSKIIDWQGN